MSSKSGSLVPVIVIILCVKSLYLLSRLFNNTDAINQSGSCAFILSRSFAFARMVVTYVSIEFPHEVRDVLMRFCSVICLDINPESS